MTASISTFSDRVEIGTDTNSPALVLYQDGTVGLGSSPTIDANSPTNRLVSMQDVVNYVQRNTTYNSAVVTAVGGEYQLNVPFSSGLYFDDYTRVVPRRITILYSGSVSGSGAQVGLRCVGGGSGSVVNLGVTTPSAWSTTSYNMPFTVATTAGLDMSGVIRLEWLGAGYVMTGYSTRINSASGRIDITQGVLSGSGPIIYDADSQYLTLQPGTLTTQTFNTGFSAQLVWEV